MNSKESQNNHYTGLCEVVAHKDYIILPVKSTHTGTWAFMSSFNGAYKYCKYEAKEGELMRIPVALQHNYVYSFRLYKPDAQIFEDTYFSMRTVPPSIDDRLKSFIQHLCDTKAIDRASVESVLSIWNENNF